MSRDAIVYFESYYDATLSTTLIGNGMYYKNGDAYSMALTAGNEVDCGTVPKIAMVGVCECLMTPRFTSGWRFELRFRSVERSYGPTAGDWHRILHLGPFHQHPHAHSRC